MSKQQSIFVRNCYPKKHHRNYFLRQWCRFLTPRVRRRRRRLHSIFPLWTRNFSRLFVDVPCKRCWNGYIAWVVLPARIPLFYTRNFLHVNQTTPSCPLPEKGKWRPRWSPAKTGTHSWSSVSYYQPLFRTVADVLTRDCPFWGYILQPWHVRKHFEVLWLLRSGGEWS